MKTRETRERKNKKVTKRISFLGWYIPSRRHLLCFGPLFPLLKSFYSSFCEWSARSSADDVAGKPCTWEPLKLLAYGFGETTMSIALLKNLLFPAETRKTKKRHTQILPPADNVQSGIAPSSCMTPHRSTPQSLETFRQFLTLSPKINHNSPKALSNHNHNHHHCHRRPSASTDPQG